MTLNDGLKTAGIPLATLLLGWYIGTNQDSIRTSIRSYPESASGSMVDPETTTDMSVVWDAWRALQEVYIAPEELAPDTLVLGAAEGLVRAVGDPYTVFMSPEEDASFRQSLDGRLQGIGAELSMKDGLVTVVAPLKSSPAERAGMLPGDVIAEVDGATVDDLTLDQVISKIRGDKGTSVTLTVYRGNSVKPISLSITREEIHVPTLESKILSETGGSLGYVALQQFGEDSMQEMREALAAFKGKPPKGIILDLRFNGGGYLDGAVDLTSMFLSTGDVVSVERRGEETQTHRVTGSTIFPGMPLVVLINEGSASASEIVAGALQDHNRATIIGMKSFGKGTVQELLDLPGGSSLRVTIAHWLTPNGKNLGKEGVHPDIEMDRTAEDFQEDRDPQLNAAVAWLLRKEDLSKAQSSSRSSR